MSKFILALDQGTTGSTALLMSPTGQILAKAGREYEQHFPNPGWVEHDPQQIWESILGATQDVLALGRVSARDCLAIGITNQRETTLVWDRKTGEPIHRAIVWQDRRTAALCRDLSSHRQDVRERTGLVLDPYFSATKVSYILDHVASARPRAERGELAFGTIDSWLVWMLSGGKAHVTDASNASRTMLYNLHTGTWDSDLCALFRVPTSVLPEVRSSAEVYAQTFGFGPLPDGIPISGMAGDQQSALFGQACFSVGEAKCTYGTGAFLLQNTGSEIPLSGAGLVTTVAWRLGATTTFALEGSAFIAGAAVQWLRDGLGVIQSSRDIESKAREVESAGEVTFVPALSGLGAPYWDPDARGLLCGITRDTTLAHICRATLDGIAFQICDLAQAMGQDTTPMKRLRVDGGASQNALLMQIQADLLGIPVDRPANVETTATGAAYLAGIGAGIFSGTEDIEKHHRIERVFHSQSTSEQRSTELQRWHRAVARSRSTLSS